MPSFRFLFTNGRLRVRVQNQVKKYVHAIKITADITTNKERDGKKRCSTSLPGGNQVDGSPPAASSGAVVLGRHLEPRLFMAEASFQMRLRKIANVVLLLNSCSQTNHVLKCDFTKEWFLGMHLELFLSGAKNLRAIWKNKNLLQIFKFIKN